MTDDIWLRLGLSLAIGMLIGVQRERQKEVLAGVRTFALVALFGTVCGLLAAEYGGLVLVGGLIAMGAIVAVGSYVARETTHDTTGAGITTEIAMLLVFAVGAWIAKGPVVPAVVVGATIFVLLYAKRELHGWANRLEDRDWQVIARFVLVSCVILPVLPDRTFGPFDVLNPREIWLMVVLIVGLGLAGFLVQKIFGERAGLAATGLLGGLISSTATTVTYSRAVKRQGSGQGSAAIVIMLASTVVYPRLLAAVSIAAPSFTELRLPLAIMGGTSLVLCGVLFIMGQRDGHDKHEGDNPSEFRTAFVFAGMYALISLASAAAQHWFGDSGLYLVAGASGLTDLDAITLSTARLVASGKLEAAHGWRMIVLAIVSNLAFKSGLVMALGSKKLFVRAGIMMLVSGLVGVVLIFIL